jgi:hypothetical protein
VDTFGQLMFGFAGVGVRGRRGRMGMDGANPDEKESCDNYKVNSQFA